MPDKTRRRRRPVKLDLGETIIPFGKFKGKTFDEVAQTRDGLRWIDWAVDGWSDCAARDQLRQYAAEIADEIADAL